MTEDEAKSPVDVLLYVLHPIIGAEVQGSLTLRTGETIAHAVGELVRVTDRDDRPGADPFELVLRIGSASFAIQLDTILGLQPFALGSGVRVGVSVELPLYDLTIHWPQEEDPDA